MTEHTLRRKTPNGTLAAGYDASLGDRAVTGPAAKHVLVSSLPNNARSRVAPTTPSAHQWQSPANNMYSMPPWNQINSLDYGTEYNGPFRQAAPKKFQQGPAHRPSIDSVLDQTLPIQSPAYYFQPGSTVPTVLPANLQHYPGPTASIGTDLYGPYWPDGGFIPYRPAPIRDPRFNTHIELTNVPFGHFSHIDTNLKDRLHNSSFMGANRQQNADYGQPTMPIQSLPAAYGKQFPTYTPGNDNIVNLPYPSQQYQNTSSGTQTPVGLEWQDRPRRRSTDLTFTGMGNQPGNVQFKERVFTWAHGIYVDLLTSLQRRQKSNPYRSDAEGRRASKPTIFPKPPRQPGYDASSSMADSGKHAAIKSGRMHAADAVMFDSPFQGHVDSENSTPKPSINNNQLSPWRAGQNLQSFSNHYADRSHTIRRSSGSAVSAMFSSPQNSSELFAKALAAFDMLENLCKESPEEWIDGMLLAGCLAYGLSEYQRALYWYQRILDHDRSHVEAMSNLAASLLALNRKEEALQFWMEAVRLRPGHFEAVEHLIALLCSCHRGKEALHVIELVESRLRVPQKGEYLRSPEQGSELESEAESISTTESVDRAAFEGDDNEGKSSWDDASQEMQMPGYGSSGFRIPGSENGRILSLIHAKANMLFGLRDYQGTAAAFEEAVLIATGRKQRGIKGLIKHIQQVLVDDVNATIPMAWHQSEQSPILLLPDKALQTAKLIFPRGELPGLEYIHLPKARNAAISTTSNALLCLAKIYQDSMSQSGLAGGGKALDGVRDVLALYYLSLSLHPSASTANNIGLLLTSVQHLLPPNPGLVPSTNVLPDIGIVPGSPTAIALAFYNYGLYLDNRHSHLYTNLGSLLKDVGQVSAAVRMYEQAVQCEGDFDIALANLANALKDQGRMADAIKYYQRAVTANPDFAEAVCGLATSLNSVCSWIGRGGIHGDQGLRDRWHVNETGMLVDSRNLRKASDGWMKNVIDTVEKQLRTAETWGHGVLTVQAIETLVQQVIGTGAFSRHASSLASHLRDALSTWSTQHWEGSRVVKLVERATRCLSWQWYQDLYVHGREYPRERYRRPSLPSALTTPLTPTVLPFHAFTTPLSAKQVRLISQQNALRMSVSTLRSSWLPRTVFPPPPPPAPYLNVGYVSSDFNNHPLAHLMQNVFGFHDPSRVRAICYATTPSDGSIHRQKIEADAPIFHDASTWTVEKLVNQVVKDKIHILINLNGYTRGARNEIFAARPAPISMSFMGFAGTLGAEWCDYLLSDEICVPYETLSPWRRNVTIEDKLHPDSNAEDQEDWVYSENIIFTRASFFCCDHRQSGPDTDRPRITWDEEQRKRWDMRREIFPHLADDAVIFGNFNQLYKVCP